MAAVPGRLPIFSPIARTTIATPAFGLSSQGTLILLYHRQHNYDAEGNYQGGVRVEDRKPVALMATRSFDSGLTWEEPYPLSIDALPTGSPYGKIVTLADGTPSRTHLQQPGLGRRKERPEIRLFIPGPLP